MFGLQKNVRTKWDRGRIIVIGGSAGTAFAVHYTSLSSMRSGAGLTVAIVPYQVVGSLDNQCTYKVFTFPTYRKQPNKHVLQLMNNSDAAVIGMGIEENHTSIILFMNRIMHVLPIWVVGDADLVLATANNNSWLKHRKRTSNILLTLNYRETEAVLGSVHHVEKKAQHYCKEFQVALLLKHKTAKLITDTGTLFSESNSGLPEMATAGCGDVLSGLIGGLLAQKHSLDIAVHMALRLRRKAAEIYLKESGDVVVHPTDLISRLPSAWYTVVKSKRRHSK